MTLAMYILIGVILVAAIYFIVRGKKPWNDMTWGHKVRASGKGTFPKRVYLCAFRHPVPCHI